MYSGLFLIRYGKTHRHDFHEGRSSYSQTTGKRRYNIPCRTTWEAPGWVRRQKDEEKAWAQAFAVVSLGKTRQAMLLRLDGLNSFIGSGLWEVVSSYQVPGPRVI